MDIMIILKIIGLIIATGLSLVGLIFIYFTVKMFFLLRKSKKVIHNTDENYKDVVNTYHQEVKTIQ
jgi:hypothetical protein